MATWERLGCPLLQQPGWTSCHLVAASLVESLQSQVLLLHLVARCHRGFREMLTSAGRYRADPSWARLEPGRVD